MLILMVTNLLFLSSVSSLDFQLNSPAEVNQNESFVVSIVANNSVSDNYDVKIFVHDDVKQYCEIFNGTGWRSPGNYLISFFPAKTEYELKAYIPEDTQICARLRKTGSTSTPPAVCNPIKINQFNSSISLPENSFSEDNATSTSSENQSVTSSETPPEEPVSYSSPDSTANTDSTGSSVSGTSNAISNTPSSDSSEKIILNQKASVSSPGTSSFATSQDNAMLWLVYSFTGFCVVMIILLWLRKI